MEELVLFLFALNLIDSVVFSLPHSHYQSHFLLVYLTSIFSHFLIGPSSAILIASPFFPFPFSYIE